ncbi:uncharacterized protein LOC62_03G004267 [Vanrija pseudolonga]|uniref:Uncharacterized protein n=1 Tax=Vanrija pseudolonga TaxID=143232 RepID=A0AAF1BQC1_9TREE|nr:hypothetical protein LOC62_03G004267 [Vanrija pseudolonga]
MAPVTIPTKFTVTSWDQNKVKPENDLVFNPNIAISEREYTGEMEGKVTAAYAMFKHSNSENAEDGSFYGMQVFTGTLQGKKGSFAAHVSGTYVGGKVSAKLTIVPESSTDELKGIKGHGTFVVPDVPANVAKHKVDPNFKDVVDGELTFEL